MMPAYPAALRMLDEISAGPELGELLGGHAARLLISKMPDSDVALWLVDCPTLYAREENIYNDWADNHLRFGVLARAAAFMAIAGTLTGWRPDIVHANDWHTGLTPYYLKTWGGRMPRSIFTIHNMVYQGLFDHDLLPELAVASDKFSPAGLEFWGRVSFLKAGLVFADRVTTVSPTYAREVRRPPYGEGMEGVIRARRDEIVGIVNGIDEQVWNPVHDPLIARTYSAKTLPDKLENKKALASLGLNISPERPVLGLVSRLVSQKGIDIVLAALPALVREGAQLAILGSGDAALEKNVAAAAAAYPGIVAARVGYDEGLAHRIIAGSDMILMPSRFEPCGLTQLYGQRYGSLPLVHRIGGLADTIRDLEDGFSFADLTALGVGAAVTRAIGYYRDAKTWRRMQERAMSKKLGWDACATHYIDLYRDLTSGVGTYHGTGHRAHA
jgi:starch synthase